MSGRRDVTSFQDGAGRAAVRGARRAGRGAEPSRAGGGAGGRTGGAGGRGRRRRRGRGGPAGRRASAAADAHEVRCGARPRERGVGGRAQRGRRARGVCVRGAGPPAAGPPAAACECVCVSAGQAAGPGTKPPARGASGRRAPALCACSSALRSERPGEPRCLTGGPPLCTAAAPRRASCCARPAARRARLRAAGAGRPGGASPGRALRRVGARPCPQTSGAGGRSAGRERGWGRGRPAGGGGRSARRVILFICLHGSYSRRRGWGGVVGGEAAILSLGGGVSDLRRGGDAAQIKCSRAAPPRTAVSRPRGSEPAADPPGPGRFRSYLSRVSRVPSASGVFRR